MYLIDKFKQYLNKDLVRQKEFEKRLVEILPLVSCQGDIHLEAALSEVFAYFKKKVERCL